MPFGLTNAPASFQGYINKIFAEKLDIFVLVYLDNILNYIEDDGDGHVIAVQCVLKKFRKFSLYANLKKYRFYQDKVQFLGYVVSLRKASAWKTKKPRLLSSGLSPSQYKISRSSSDLPTFIGNSSKDSVR